MIMHAADITPYVLVYEKLDLDIAPPNAIQKQVLGKGQALVSGSWRASGFPTF